MRVTRKLFTLASAVSLLVIAVLVVLWVRSYRVSEQVAWGELLSTKSLGTSRKLETGNWKRGQKPMIPRGAGISCVLSNLLRLNGCRGQAEPG